MAETSGNGAPAGGNGAPAGATQASNQPPGIHVLGQYVKDLSFENPGAPASLRPSDKAPKLDVNVNVNVKTIAQGDFEVELKLEANAARAEDTLFIVEVTYAGLFQIRNVPQEHLHPLLLIECPRLLFPFARQIVADATRQGGFPPLMIDPIDFTALYRQRAAQAAAQQPAPQPS
jgi:preprotein translocase subunit SecB